MNNVGQLLNLSTTLSSGTGDMSYVWKFWDGDVKVTTVPSVQKRLNQGGTLDYSVTVVDPLGQTDVKTGTVNVNYPPVINSITISKNDTPATYTTNVVVTVTDPDYTSGNITVQLGATSHTISAGSGSATFNSISVSATTDLLLTVTDPDGGVVTMTVELRVAPSLGMVPVGSATPNPARIGVGQNILLQGTATHLDGKSINTFTWTRTVAGGWSDNFTDSVTPTLISTLDKTCVGSVSVSIAAETPGLKKVTLTSIDSDSVSTQADFYVTLSTNQPPVINRWTFPATIVAGQAVTIGVDASDPEDDHLDYLWNIRRTITSMTASGTTVTVTCPNHGLSLGQSVIISGAFPSSYNGTFHVTSVVSSSVFKYTALSSTTLIATGMLIASTQHTANPLTIIAPASVITGYVVVTDSLGASVTKDIPKLVITSDTAITGIVGQPFSYQITAMGASPITYSTSTLPSGLVLRNDTISGVPTADGIADVTITATNSSGTATLVLRITVEKPTSAPPLAPNNLQVFNSGSFPSYTSGQDLPIRWTVIVDSAGTPGYYLEFRTEGDVLKGTAEVASGVDTFTLLNSQIISLFGSQVNVVIRVYGKRAGVKSTTYKEITVVKI